MLRATFTSIRMQLSARKKSDRLALNRSLSQARSFDISRNLLNPIQTPPLNLNVANVSSNNSNNISPHLQPQDQHLSINANVNNISDSLNQQMLEFESLPLEKKLSFMYLQMIIQNSN